MSTSRTLGDLQPAQTGRVTALRLENHLVCHELGRHGIYLGATVQVLRKDRTHMFVSTGLREVVLDRQVASQVLVESTEKVTDSEIVR